MRFENYYIPIDLDPSKAKAFITEASIRTNNPSTFEAGKRVFKRTDDFNI